MLFVYKKRMIIANPALRDSSSRLKQLVNGPRDFCTCVLYDVRDFSDIYGQKMNYMRNRETVSTIVSVYKLCNYISFRTILFDEESHSSQ
ncbi:hypothetical protein V1477_007641, partial [Vespula maculifrons]